MRRILRLTLILGMVGAFVSAIRKRAGGGGQPAAEESVHGHPESVPPEGPAGHAFTSGSSDPAPPASEEAAPAEEQPSDD